MFPAQVRPDTETTRVATEINYTASPYPPLENVEMTTLVCSSPLSR